MTRFPAGTGVDHNDRVPTSPRYIALLRGINVGGRAKVPMAGLRATCESVGCTDVLTYIQSGNVVLTSPLDPVKLRAALEDAIAEQLGVSPVVVIRTHRQLPNGMGRDKLPELFGQRVKTPATVRNLGTVNKLAEMSAN